MLRVVLVAGASLSIAVSAVEILEIAATGTASLSAHRLVRLELGSAAMSVVSAWYLGWRF